MLYTAAGVVNRLLQNIYITPRKIQIFESDIIILLKYIHFIINNILTYTFRPRDSEGTFMNLNTMHALMIKLF